MKAAVSKSKFRKLDVFGVRLAGHILLQDHGGEVWYRNIRIRDLHALDSPEKRSPSTQIVFTLTGGDYSEVATSCPGHLGVQGKGAPDIVRSLAGHAPLVFMGPGTEPKGALSAARAAPRPIGQVGQW